jgi:hypothetical protein
MNHPDDGGSMYLWNVGLLQRGYTALYPRRLSSSRFIWLSIGYGDALLWTQLSFHNFCRTFWPAERLLASQGESAVWGYISSSSSLARQPYVGLGLPQKLLPANVSGCCFFRFRDKNLFQGGVVSPTPNPRLSCRADVLCQDCLSNFKASGARFLSLHDLAV